MPRVSLKRAACAAAFVVLAACAHRSPFDVRQPNGASAPAKVRVGNHHLDAELVRAGRRRRVRDREEHRAGRRIARDVPTGAAGRRDGRRRATCSWRTAPASSRGSTACLRDAGSRDLRVVVCTDGLPVKNLNPHLWMDPVLAKRYVLADPRRADRRRSRARHRLSPKRRELQRAPRRPHRPHPRPHRHDSARAPLHDRVPQRLAVLQRPFRHHDAGLRRAQSGAGTQSRSRSRELIDLAKAHGVRAVFSEPEYSPKLLYAIAQGAGIKVVEDLYDDSIGTDPRVANYFEMLDLRHQRDRGGAASEPPFDCGASRLRSG